jgi:predicted nucleotidyltransferase
MPYGLNEKTIAKIRGVLAKYPHIDKAVLYGSRAKGTFKPGSDIDLSLHGAGLSLLELGRIESELDDLLLPYSIDLLIFDTLDHAGLRDHIQRVGVVLYQRCEEAEGNGTAGPPP